jgi:hypothetical protein
VEQTGRIVSHGVGWARNVVVAPEEAVERLVEAINAKEVCSRRVRADGALGAPADCGSIVVEHRDGAFTKIDILCKDILMGNNARQLEVTVG